jgi:hypothetical protein
LTRKKLRIALILTATMAVSLLTSTRLPADTGNCGGPVTLPFTDVMTDSFFCNIAEAYFSGLTNGTTPTTYNPSDGVPRDQMAAFIPRAQDSALRRGSAGGAAAVLDDHSALRHSAYGLDQSGNRAAIRSIDAEDLWVANNAG